MATKGQKFTKYTEEIKKEVVRLRVEKGQPLTHIKERYGIKVMQRLLTGFGNLRQENV